MHMKNQVARFSRSWSLAIPAVVLMLTMLLSAGAALAAVTFDSATGTGFVGKGDVQDVFDWNNKQLQDNAGSVQFRFVSEKVEETTWTCDRDAGPQIQERNRTTTTTTQQIVDKIAREKNQITGFNLTGYSGPAQESSTTEGPPEGSCPTGWTLTEGPTTETISSSGVLQVSSGGDWFDLQ
jgi:hypothetical protein